MTSACAKNGPESDKPILLMTPTDLFSNPQLRALAKAAQHGDVDKMNSMIAEGVSVNGKGKYGIGPLFSAWQARNKLGYETLLDHGANPNNIWSNGYTLMNALAGYSDEWFLDLALQHGGNPNLVEPHTGVTPIFEAVSVDGKKNIPILIKAGANLNYQKPYDGTTAMMQAVLNAGQYDVIYELLQAGADYRLKNKDGETLADYVQFFNKEDNGENQNEWREKVIDFLKQHDAWPNKPNR